MTLVLSLVLAIAVAVLLVFVVGYNKLRSADVRVDEALGGIDVELTRRAALIPAVVHVVESFAHHERTVLDKMTTARAQLDSATRGASVSQRSVAEQQLDSALGQVVALGQSYPQLASSSNFAELQRSLTDTEDKLAFARQYYNDAAATVNKLISTIPWMYVAGAAGVAKREYYQIPR